MNATPYGSNTSGASNPKRILVVDDHPIFRRGLTELLRDQPTFLVCGEANSATKALGAMRDLKPDVVVIDIELPGSNGIELLKQMASERPNLRFLVVSVHEENHFALRALRAGGKGYIMKSEEPAQILFAVHQVSKGLSYMSPLVQRNLISKVSQSPLDSSTSPVENLSDRKFEIFQLLGAGMSTREIAEKLTVTGKTVETHRQHLKEKRNCQTATEVVRRAINWTATGG